MAVPQTSLSFPRDKKVMAGIARWNVFNMDGRKVLDSVGSPCRVVTVCRERTSCGLMAQGGNLAL